MSRGDSAPSQSLLHWPGLRQISYALGLSAALTAWFAFVYGGADWFTQQHTYRVRVHFEFEREMPLVPPLILGYLSLNPLLWLSPFVLRSRRELRAFALTLGAATAIAGIGFLLCPAEEIFIPVENRDRGAWQGWFLLTKQIALRHNYLPSLHVAFATVCTLAYLDRASRAASLVLVAWWSVITASTLLIHQHYLLDLVTGAMLGWIMFKLVYRRLQSETHPNRSADRAPSA